MIFASFNKICNLLSEILKFKNYQFKSLVASTGSWLRFVFTAVDRVSDKPEIAYDKFL